MVGNFCYVDVSGTWVVVELGGWGMSEVGRGRMCSCVAIFVVVSGIVCFLGGSVGLVRLFRLRSCRLFVSVSIRLVDFHLCL